MNWKPGTIFDSDSVSWMPIWVSLSPEAAWIDIPTFWMFSWRLFAVTMISVTVAGAETAAASAATAPWDCNAQIAIVAAALNSATFLCDILTSSL